MFQLNYLITREYPDEVENFRIFVQELYFTGKFIPEKAVFAENQYT